MDCLRPSENKNVYLMIDSSGKITVMKGNENNFMTGVITTFGPVLMVHSVRKVQNRCSDLIDEESQADRDGGWKRSGP